MTHEGKSPVELQLALLEVALEFSGRPMTTRLRERFVEKLLRCYLSQAPGAERGNPPASSRALLPGRGAAAAARAPLPQRGSIRSAGAAKGAPRRRASGRRGRLPGVCPAPGRAH